MPGGEGGGGEGLGGKRVGSGLGLGLAVLEGSDGVDWGGFFFEPLIRERMSCQPGSRRPGAPIFISSITYIP